METTNTEYKELLALNERLLLLINLTNEFRNKPKQLKVCTKLVKAEYKSLKKVKTFAAVDDFGSLQWRYSDLTEISKNLKKSNSAGVINKNLSDLDNLKQKTEGVIKELKDKLNPIVNGINNLSSAIGSTAQKLSKKLEQGAQKFGDSFSEAVNGAVEEVKKRLAGDEN